MHGLWSGDVRSASSVTRETFDTGCTCHRGHPPCGFCVGMAEEEAEAYAARGMFGLIPFIDRMCNEDYEMMMEKINE